MIDVVSDVVCPWCYIGKRRLEKALKLLDAPEVEVRWKAFQLNPNAPVEGFDRLTYRIRKFGSLSYAKELEARVAAAGAEEGIEFRFDRIKRIPNTFNAHRLIWLAGREGVQDTVVERLFSSYFLEGEDAGSIELLTRIGVESGLGIDSVEKLFDTDLGSQEVQTDEDEARVRGVSGVPTFFAGGEPVTSGAQKPELLALVLGSALGTEPAAQCSLDDGCD